MAFWTQIKEKIDNINVKEDQTAKYDLLFSSFTITSDPNLIADIYKNKNITRSDMGKRMLDHVVAKNSLVAQNDTIALIKKPILQKHYKVRKVYKQLNSLCDDIISEIDSHLLDNQKISIHSIIYNKLAFLFLESLFGVIITSQDKKFIENVGLFNKDKSCDTPLMKLAMINYFGFFLPRIVRQWLDRDAIDRNKKADLISEYILKNCAIKKNSLLNDLKKIDLDFDNLKGECNLILANANSVAISLQWAIYAAIKNPHIQDKIIESIDYTKSAYLETLRMYPVFHLLPYQHKSKCPFAFKKKHYLISVLATHMSDKNWTNPRKFIPERFNDLNLITKGSYIPFGGTSRSCPGAGIAITIAPIVLKSLITNYSLRLNSEPVIKRRIELVPKGMNLDLVFSKRQNFIE